LFLIQKAYHLQEIKTAPFLKLFSAALVYRFAHIAEKKKAHRMDAPLESVRPYQAASSL
jgi:hypothetical protein